MDTTGNQLPVTPPSDQAGSQGTTNTPAQVNNQLVADEAKIESRVEESSQPGSSVPPGEKPKSDLPDFSQIGNSNANLENDATPAPDLPAEKDAPIDTANISDNPAGPEVAPAVPPVPEETSSAPSEDFGLRPAENQSPAEVVNQPESPEVDLSSMGSKSSWAEPTPTETPVRPTDSSLPISAMPGGAQTVANQPQPEQPTVEANAINSPNSGSVAPALADQNTVPAEISGFSWAAFMGSFIWAIGNRVWVGLLALLGPLWLPMIFILGAKGNAWAWKARKFASVEEFKKTQRSWTIFGVILFIAQILIIYIIYIALFTISSGTATTY